MSLSIVIPAYNAEKYINQCLRSITKSQIEMEVIVIDDGSTDSTKKIVFEVMLVDARVKYYYQPNSGVSKARNFGIKETHNQYIMFIDADDYIEDGFLEECYKSIGAVDFLCAGYTSVSPDGSQKLEIFRNSECDYSNREFANNIYQWISPPYLLSPWSKIFRNDVIKNNNIYFREDMSYGEDVVFVFEYLSHINRIRCISNPGYFYRNSSNSLSSTFRRAIIDSDMVGLSAIEEYLRGQKAENMETTINRRLVDIFTMFYVRLLKSNEKISNKNRILIETSKLYKPRKAFNKVRSRAVSCTLIRILLNIYAMLFKIDN